MFGKTNPTLTERDVLDALKGVKDPDLGRDLVDLGMIKDIRIGDGTVALTVNLTTPACPLKAQIERDVRTALQNRLPGEWSVNITMTAEVRGKGITETGDIPGIKNVIAVGSGKGGVGKSTMAAAIAYGLRSYGSSVGLMDADVYGPSIPHLVGATGRPMARGDRIQPIETNGLKLMSMGFLLEPEKAVIMRGPMLHGIMQQFLRQVDWGPLDYLVIDLPPGTGDVPLTLGTDSAPDRSRGRLHAAGSGPARRHPRHHDVPPAQGPGARDDREHVLLRRAGLPQGSRRARGQAARREQDAASTRPATSGSTSSAAAAPGGRPRRWASRSSAKCR